MAQEHSFDSRAYAAGARSAIPLAVPAVPFGLLLGVVIADSSIANSAGWSSSWLIFAGSAQLAAMELISSGSAAAVVIATVTMINARHIMYSAALAPRVVGAPGWFRVLGSYILVDQVFAVTENQPDSTSTRTMMWRWLGAATVFWSVWQIFTVVGIFVGDVIPDEWSLDFAVPLLFGGLMILAIRNRPGIVAAIVGAVVAVAGRDLPQGVGLLIGIIVGVAAGALAERTVAK